MEQIVTVLQEKKKKYFISLEVSFQDLDDNVSLTERGHIPLCLTELNSSFSFKG